MGVADNNSRGVELFDTHCHIHDSSFDDKFGKSKADLVSDAVGQGVKQLVCVGTDVASSQEAVDTSSEFAECYASLALHPHEAAKLPQEDLKKQIDELDQIISEAPKTAKIVGIGECGLDYFYHDDSETHQKQEFLLRLHLELAKKYDLPVIFHIRDAEKAADESTPTAFAEFFRIIDDYPKLTGVVHSFTSTTANMQGVVDRGLYIGLNGIITFTKQQYQLDAVMAAPLENILLETDAPYLTPRPFRGTMCEPKHVRNVAEFISSLRSEEIQDFAAQTTSNAEKLFRVKRELKSRDTT